MQRIERGEIALARHAGDALDSLGDELIDQDLTAAAVVEGDLVHDNILQAAAIRSIASIRLISEAA